MCSPSTSTVGKDDSRAGPLSPLCLSSPRHLKKPPIMYIWEMASTLASSDIYKALLQRTNKCVWEHWSSSHEGPCFGQGTEIFWASSSDFQGKGNWILAGSISSFSTVPRRKRTTMNGHLFPPDLWETWALLLCCHAAALLTSRPQVTLHPLGWGTGCFPTHWGGTTFSTTFRKLELFFWGCCLIVTRIETLHAHLSSSAGASDTLCCPSCPTEDWKYRDIFSLWPSGNVPVTLWRDCDVRTLSMASAWVGQRWNEEVFDVKLQ